MERLRAIFGWIVDQTQTERPRERGRAIRVEQCYECAHCSCTFGAKPEQCPECGSGRVARSGPGYDSKPGFRCRTCRATVDHRYELCPECGSPRFEGVR